MRGAAGDFSAAPIRTEPAEGTAEMTSFDTPDGLRLVYEEWEAQSFTALADPRFTRAIVEFRAAPETERP